MSGQTSFYVEQEAGGGAWNLLVDGDEPAYLADWGNRTFKMWVFDGVTWEGVGDPPRAVAGLPKSPSTGLLSEQMQEILEDQHVGWMWLSDLLACQDEEVQGWNARVMEPGLRKFGLDRASQIRLILATD